MQIAQERKKGIVRNSNCAVVQLAKFAQLANYFAQRPPLDQGSLDHRVMG